MGRFTAGERRGLIVLMVVLAVLTLVMFIKSRISYSGSEMEVSGETPTVRFDSVSRSGDQYASDSIKIGRKGKKKATNPKVAPSRRDPLDEELN